MGREMKQLEEDTERIIELAAFQHKVMLESIYWLRESTDLVPINPTAPKIEQVCLVSLPLLIEVFASAGLHE